MRLWNSRSRNCLRCCLLVISLGCGQLPAQAGRRPPTAAERVVVDHFREAIIQLLEPAVNEDWESDPTGDRDIPDNYMVSERLEVPFEITATMQRSYHVTTGSPYYQRVMAPLIEQMQGMTDPQAMKNLFAHVERTEVTISIVFNWASATIDDEPPRLKNLVVPGAALAWQIPEDRQKKVTLLFGKWSGAAHGERELLYRFRQKGKYLAIENAVIELEGNSSRIDELLKTVDWNRVNAALYPAA